MSNLLDRMVNYQLWQEREAAHLRAYSTSPSMPELAEMHEEIAVVLLEARKEIERLRAALAKIAAWDAPWPENNEGYAAMAVVTARAALGENKR